eukprot:c327_g1_i1.p1 GENE.c327_g1_i1~~c327_g1_i1.p1  ORF type:complete len:198 (+),score=31.09 c327_g1_i1:274-867(+)
MNCFSLPESESAWTTRTQPPVVTDLDTTDFPKRPFPIPVSAIRKSLLTAELQKPPLLSPLAQQVQPKCETESDTDSTDSLTYDDAEQHQIRIRYYQALNLKSQPIPMPTMTHFRPSSYIHTSHAFSAPVAIPLPHSASKTPTQTNHEHVDWLASSSVAGPVNQGSARKPAQFVPPHELIKNDESIDMKPQRKDKFLL